MVERKENGGYKEAMRKDVIPLVEKMTNPEIWTRNGDGTFLTGVLGSLSSALPRALYEVVISKTGEITMECVKGDGPQMISTTDERITKLYSALEKASTPKPVSRRR